MYFQGSSVEKCTGESEGKGRGDVLISVQQAKVLISESELDKQYIQVLLQTKVATWMMIVYNKDKPYQEQKKIDRDITFIQLI